MKHYFLKLLPPRPSFPGDMTPEEGQLMQAHVGYWAGLGAAGGVVVLGPVADPRGVFGMGVLQLPDEADPAALTADDPVIRAGAGFRYEIYPMPSALVPARS